MSKNIVMDITLMDMVITTIGVIVTMAILSCMCCICMKISDLKMKSCIIELAKQKGVMVDPDKLTSQQRESPHAAENCTIMIPDLSWSLALGQEEEEAALNGRPGGGARRSELQLPRTETAWTTVGPKGKKKKGAATPSLYSSYSKPGHKAADCVEEPSCFFYAERGRESGHVPGTNGCITAASKSPGTRKKRKARPRNWPGADKAGASETAPAMEVEA